MMTLRLSREERLNLVLDEVCKAYDGGRDVFINGQVIDINDADAIFAALGLKVIEAPDG